MIILNYSSLKYPILKGIITFSCLLSVFFCLAVLLIRSSFSKGLVLNSSSPSESSLIDSANNVPYLVVSPDRLSLFVYSDTVSIDSSISKNTKKHIVTSSSTQSDFELLLTSTHKLIYSGKYQEALKSIEILRSRSISGSYSSEIEYLRSKCITNLYLIGSASGPQVISSWQNVKTFFPRGSKRYLEADSVLNLFGVLK